ncbi:MAG: hypothetical protein H0X37_27145 [Herpetosiphonaceae bacterium]|nr:hypothetical protein [Herpetosiphonaceae bacterium]
MTKRRVGTAPHRTFWTTETVQAIETYQAQHQIPSFSAAAETLVRLGLNQSPAEVLTPIIVSTVRREFAVGMERIVRLLVYDIIETGVAQRLAGAAVYHLYEQTEPRSGPEKYDLVKQQIRDDAYRTFSRAKISTTLDELAAVNDELEQEGEA